MFLTKKALRKILWMVILYLVLGTVCIGLSVLFKAMDISAPALAILGVITYLLCIIMAFCGWYAEGKGILLNLGNKLVRHELKPAEFIRHYEALQNADDLVVKKPDLDVLQLVAVAYDVLDRREKVLATVDEMIAAAGDKKKAFVQLIRCSYLFSYGQTQEAESLFSKLQKQTLDVMCRGFVDAIWKLDRAIAMGDYQTAEVFCLNILDCSFPKTDPLGKLVTHFQLGEIYEGLQEREKAVTHYQYCADFGGETAIRTVADQKLLALKQWNEE